jgi:hypothetical protein
MEKYNRPKISVIRATTVDVSSSAVTIKIPVSACAAGTFDSGLPLYTVGAVIYQRRYDMNGRFQMQGGKNWILPK